ncbi:MAG: hypothetical protein ACM3MK_08945 [Chitinophagales bacterium]
MLHWLVECRRVSCLTPFQIDGNWERQAPAWQPGESLAIRFYKINVKSKTLKVETRTSYCLRLTSRHK